MLLVGNYSWNLWAAAFCGWEQRSSPGWKGCSAWLMCFVNVKVICYANILFFKLLLKGQVLRNEVALCISCAVGHQTLPDSESGRRKGVCRQSSLHPALDFLQGLALVCGTEGRGARRRMSWKPSAPWLWAAPRASVLGPSTWVQHPPLLPRSAVPRLFLSLFKTRPFVKNLVT